MASLRTTREIKKPLTRKPISTRSNILKPLNEIEPSKINIIPNVRNKRKASPGKHHDGTQLKRSALGNLTNTNANASNILIKDDKKLFKKSVSLAVKVIDENFKKTELKKSTQNDLDKLKVNSLLPPRTRKIVTRAAAKNITNLAKSQLCNSGTIVKPNNVVEAKKQTKRRISDEFENTDDSLYMSALEDISESAEIKSNITSENVSNNNKCKNLEVKDECSLIISVIEDESKQIQRPDLKEYIIPDSIFDFDKENWDDPFQVSHYAMDIFNYLKERESTFQITDYMAKQPYISKWMRSLLIDWMVEVQESFELNHETLYLAVKIVDIYLGKETVTKEALQLLGAAALFLASKFDERIPPLIDDFLYICDGAYDQKELIRMEMNVFKTINYDLGIPLSYRFLRRYARCGQLSMPILTLARYILEYSLMDYATIQFQDSKMAAASLFIALKMNNMPDWKESLQYYSGYILKDFADVVVVLNQGLHRKPKDSISTIRNKYSHKVFLEVALTPLLSTNELLKDIK